MNKEAMLDKWAEGFDDICVTNKVDAVGLIKRASLWGKIVQFLKLNKKPIGWGAAGLGTTSAGTGLGYLGGNIKGNVTGYQAGAKQLYDEMKSKGLLDVGLGAIWKRLKPEEQSMIQGTAIGTGIGTLGGAAVGAAKDPKEKENRLSNMVTGGAIGGLGGLALGGMYGYGKPRYDAYMASEKEKKELAEAAAKALADATNVPVAKA